MRVADWADQYVLSQLFKPASLYGQEQKGYIPGLGFKNRQGKVPYRMYEDQLGHSSGELVGGTCFYGIWAGNRALPPKSSHQLMTGNFREIEVVISQKSPPCGLSRSKVESAIHVT